MRTTHKKYAKREKKNIFWQADEIPLDRKAEILYIQRPQSYGKEKLD